MFSGGFWYLRGYLNAFTTLAEQVRNRRFREWYLHYADFGGPQHLFSAPPGRTVRQLQHTGFVVEDVRGASGEWRPTSTSSIAAISRSAISRSTTYVRERYRIRLTR